MNNPAKYLEYVLQFVALKAQERFFGRIIISMQAGKPTDIKEEKNWKVEELEQSDRSGEGKSGIEGNHNIGGYYGIKGKSE